MMLLKIARNGKKKQEAIEPKTSNFGAHWYRASVKAFISKFAKNGNIWISRIAKYGTN